VDLGRGESGSLRSARGTELRDHILFVLRLTAPASDVQRTEGDSPGRILGYGAVCATDESRVLGIPCRMDVRRIRPAAHRARRLSHKFKSSDRHETFASAADDLLGAVEIAAALKAFGNRDHHSNGPIGIVRAHLIFAFGNAARFASGTA